MPRNRSKGLFWRRALIDRKVFDRYSKDEKKIIEAVKALLNNGTHGTNYEKLRDDLASARLNDADRILLTNYELDGQNNLLVIDAAEWHEYKKSPAYNDKNGVKNYLVKNKESIEKRIREMMAEEAAAAQSPKPPAGKPEPVILDYYNQQFIRLNLSQQSVLQSGLPLVVSGAPGSGKSCVAISMLRQLAAQLPEGSEEKILYLTESPRLLKEMQAIWGSLELPPDMQRRVEFKTYAMQAAESRAEYVKDRTVCTKLEFEHWFKKYVSDRRNELKPSMANTKGKKGKTQDDPFLKLDGFLKNQQTIYQEFRLLSGY
ncbi:hypothetical protein Lbir_2162 [Legionella birminghamensis]|nr:hypothetical protein [Legionella birminghamensis]KTC69423.1 hypothetical protein Lbir_2162 [Legionella birminghamensis]